MPHPSKDSRSPVYAITAIVIVCAGLAFFMMGRQRAPQPVAKEQKAAELPSSAPVSVANSLPPALSAPVEPAPTPFAEAEVAAPAPTHAEPTPFNPEDQPRAYLVEDFQGLRNLPWGFTGENLVLTEEGIRLVGPKPGEEGLLRMGTLESPPQPLDFPSNAVTPLWREQVPDSCDLFVEVSVSPDAIHWGQWQWVPTDDDSAGQVAEFYEDGRPNPNYGYTIGSTYAWGDQQHNYMRYRVTLFSENEETPLLQGFRVYYQDSTLGQGYIAEPVTN